MSAHGIQLVGTGYVQGSVDGQQMGGTRVGHKGASEAISATDMLAQLGFSPELVLFIAQTRMGDIDGQVRASMSELDESAARSKALGEQISALHKLQEQMAGTENGKVLVDAKEGDEKHNFFVLDDGSTVSAQAYLRRVGIEVDEDMTTCLTNNGRPAINSEAIDNLLKKLEEEQQNINTGNEMRMAKLQSLMQQRTQILTLATNLLRKLDEGAQSILRNLA